MRPSTRAVAILLLACITAGGIGFLYSSGSSDSAGQDLQPVAFSHAGHAGDLKVDCLYCHRSPEVSPVASVPTVQLCISCHANLAKETKETEKLLAYWKNREPLPWVRLQRLPDFVYFTHEMHLKNGLQCVNCHGQVDRMPDTPRASSYEMGWCLSCHQQRGASRDCWTCHQ